MKFKANFVGWLGLAFLCVPAAYYYSTNYSATVNDPLQMPKTVAVPLGLPPIEWPADNPYTPEKAELGRLLFFDKRLSSDQSVACSTCHRIPEAYADNRELPQGIHGRIGTRHTPTIINVVYNKYQFWDGREPTLEGQVLGPLSNPKEMTLATERKLAFQECEKNLRQIQSYRPLFKKVFGSEECTIDQIAKAIATFERTVLSGNSAYDRFIAGDKSALDISQMRGMVVFKKSGCANCHGAPLFTNNRFENIGVGMDKPNPDLGRYLVTHEERDWGAFKVPTLREVHLTAPYMHDGSLKTLREVVDYYDRGGIPNKNLHSLMRPLRLSEEDKQDLIHFMESLSGEGWQSIADRTSSPVSK